MYYCGYSPSLRLGVTIPYVYPACTRPLYNLFITLFFIDNPLYITAGRNLIVYCYIFSVEDNDGHMIFLVHTFLIFSSLVGEKVDDYINLFSSSVTTFTCRPHPNRMRTKPRIKAAKIVAESSSDDDGVDEEGMARLMKALRENKSEDEDEGASEDDDGEGASEEEDGGANEGENEGASEEEDEGASEEDEGANKEVPLDELEAAVDEDAVPRQKIEVNDKVIYTSH